MLRFFEGFYRTKPTWRAWKMRKYLILQGLTNVFSGLVQVLSLGYWAHDCDVVMSCFVIGMDHIKVDDIKVDDINTRWNKDNTGFLMACKRELIN